MAIGIISIILAILAVLPCFVPGAMSVIGVFLSLLALLLSCISTFKGKLKYLVSVLIIVTFNIFIVSEFSFALSKHLYSHTETPLRKAIHLLTFTEEGRIKEKESLQAFKKHFGYIPKIDYKKKEGGYWQFVNMVFLIIVIPYSITIFRLYYQWRKKYLGAINE